jgi:hypothetical protein
LSTMLAQSTLLSKSLLDPKGLEVLEELLLDDGDPPPIDSLHVLVL